MISKWMNRLVAAGMALGMFVSVAACGSSSADSNKIKLTMVESLTTPVRTKIIKKLLQGFEAKNPNISVELVSPPTDSADRTIQQMLQSGEGIDVLEVRDITVGGFSKNGWLVDMTSDMKKWNGWGDLTLNAQKSAEGDSGKIMYMPYGFYGLSLFYRTDLVKDAGFSQPPKSWDDLLKQASVIQDTGKKQYGYAFRGGSNSDSNATAIIGSYVADDIDTTNAFKLKNGKTIFSSPKAVEAMDTYLKIFKKASPPSSVSWGYPEMVEGFSNGSTAFLLQDPEVISTLSKSTSISEDQWNTAPLLTGPTGKAIQPIAAAGWGVAKSSKHREAALKLIKYLSSEQPATTFAKENSLVPIIKSAITSTQYTTGKWKSYATMTKSPSTYINVTQPRSVSWWNDWVTKSDGDIQNWLLGKTSTKSLLNGWDQYWTEKWSK